MWNWIDIYVLLIHVAMNCIWYKYLTMSCIFYINGLLVCRTEFCMLNGLCVCRRCRGLLRCDIQKCGRPFKPYGQHPQGTADLWRQGQAEAEDQRHLAERRRPGRDPCWEYRDSQTETLADENFEGENQIYRASQI